MAVLTEEIPAEVQAAVKQVRGTAKKSWLLTLIRKSFLWLYRIAAIVTLYGVLAAVFGYVVLMVFYVVDHSWVAPIVVSPSDEKCLDLTDKILQTKTAAAALELDVEKLRASRKESIQHRSRLASLEPQVEAALVREARHNHITGLELDALNRQKHQDNMKTSAVMDEISAAEAQIDKDREARLITKGDAAIARTSLNQSENNFTDSRIAEVMLKDTLLQKNTVSTALLETLDKQVELISEVSQLDITIAAAERQINTECTQIEAMHQALEMARQTPYYRAMTQRKNVSFAFVPYENRAAVRIGTPVYDCELNVIVCRHVGTVKAVFPQEEHAIHPLFRTDMRGFLIEIALTHPESAEATTLMIGRKPFLF